MKLINLLFIILMATAQVGYAQTWKTFHDKRHHFNISYPVNLTSRHKFSGSYFFTKGWSVNLHQENNLRQYSLLEIQLQNFHGKDKNNEGYYFDSYVRVGSSAVPVEVAHCESASDMLVRDKQVNINGKQFAAFKVGDAAMSQYVGGNVYRRLAHGKCYSIEYLETGSNTTGLPEFTAMKEASEALGQHIISTFKFV
jgi:hypothetical protein